MSNIVLGIGDLGASNTPGDILKTFALGSCVAVVLIDTVTHTIGMVHIALPDSKISPEKARALPGYFADSGISALIKLMIKKGSRGNGRRLLAKITGGANIMNSNDLFKIGDRNVVAIKEILNKVRSNITSAHVGGTMSRTVKVSVDSFRVILSSPGQKDWEL